MYYPGISEIIRGYFDYYGELPVEEAIQHPEIIKIIEDAFKTTDTKRKPTQDEIYYHIQKAYELPPQQIQEQQNVASPMRNPWDWSSSGFRPRNMWGPKNAPEEKHQYIERGAMFNQQDYQWRPQNFWAPRKRRMEYTEEEYEGY